MAYTRKRGKNYQITVSLGRDSMYRPIQESMTFRPEPGWSESRIKKELNKAAVAFEETVRSGQLYKQSKMFFSEFAEQWFDTYVKVRLALNTQIKYDDVLRNHLPPAFGKYKLCDLTPHRIQTFLNSYYEEPIQYSHATVQKVFTVLRSIFKKAYQWQVIKENPISRVELMRMGQTGNQEKCFSAEECAAFLSYLDTLYEQPLTEHPLDNLRIQFKVLYTIILYGGFRKGEALALTWDDIDFDAGQISISKSVVYHEKKMQIKAPKTTGSVRLVSMPDSVMDLLQRFHTLQAQQKELLQDFWPESNWLFTQHDGSLMNYHTPYHTFQKILKRYNKEHPEHPLPMIPLHGLRHTNATLMLANHSDLASVAARLGHSQTSTTLNTYTHAVKSAERETGQLLEKLLTSHSNKNA